MQVPNGTGSGVRRSKRPLLASRTRCNVLWKPPKFGFTNYTFPLTVHPPPSVSISHHTSIGVPAGFTVYTPLLVCPLFFISKQSLGTEKIWHMLCMNVLLKSSIIFLISYVKVVKRFCRHRTPVFRYNFQPMHFIQILLSLSEGNIKFCGIRAGYV